MEKKPRILLCVCGGIAAYKAIDLASQLYKAGYEIRTILTQAAHEFVSPLNFAAITHSSVHSSLWEDCDPIPHISLADWADLIVVAPATANSLAKAAHGLGDDLLSSVLLAHTKPVLWVPAMNVNMYSSPATQANLSILRERGNHILEPATGMLACAYEGKGKYPPNLEILYAIRSYLHYGKDLIGKKVLVTAGASVEQIDPMRMITNRSSGKMGIALARALSLRGAEVSLIYASVTEEIPYYLFEAVQALSVDEMYAQVMSRSAKMDWIIKCAAVSDYKPKQMYQDKIKKGGSLSLDLVSTPDILAELGKNKGPQQKLIGFAAETQDLAENALRKLKSKQLDLIIANHLSNAGKATNAIHLISDKAEPFLIEGDKFELAHQIIDRILKL
ncbi:MAG: bifunctional phosphopantothenoylcysteine decarboxylase/phosphopantothenate--cysteine ligase CoaBC [Candidatus Cloacimonetes bacterium]|jgi:phosphopantothenoylcysteine decarboxylase/phosphopantothenate--cysteine ligase|nr:bifunctional phosphopantothenoylcysteine decarboxylase/phosphopantothenate--cysteine ligase CoaBC [Candidatus Cloacimonadota bacterium]MDD4276427.1 bifunctional phosphopantothenoylcysteine decarboxylase/phosphopantothenate--cysteine ligase CoaBC [Candidatus Cloacimonadota bacterium]MDY0325306.1 bifunctional phosphopantothenoylcysteine decarboxylase/phosphopantothenate--cysteine ligase CoaBC [Candidatus Cloacimonadaceae bacterium]